MRKPELRIVRFESGDVIAASGNAPVCLVLKNFGNGNTADNTLMIENGPYNGQYVQNINSNSQRATNQINDNAVSLINKAFGISTVSKDTRFFYSDGLGNFTFNNIYPLRFHGDNLSDKLNGKFSYDPTFYVDGAFIHFSNDTN